LDDPAGPPTVIPAVPRPIVRGQNPEESRPLPPGPLLSPGDPRATPFMPPAAGQDLGKPENKTDKKSSDFVAPQPKSYPPPTGAVRRPGAAPPPGAVWGGPIAGDKLLGIHGECGNPCCNPCGNPCSNLCCDPCGDSCCSKLFGCLHRLGRCCQTDACCTND